MLSYGGAHCVRSFTGKGQIENNKKAASGCDCFDWMANNLTLNGTRSSKWLADMHEIYSHDPVGQERYHVSFFKWTFDFDRRSFVWTRWKSKCKVSTALGLKVIFKSLDANENDNNFLLYYLSTSLSCGVVRARAQAQLENEVCKKYGFACDK